MKNLFTREILSEDDETYVPFENPYLAARVSPETEAMMHDEEGASDRPQDGDEAEKALKAKEKRYMLIALLGFVLMFGSFLWLNNADAFTLFSPLGLVPLGGMIVSFAAIYKLKRLEWKKNGIDEGEGQSVDFEAMAARIEKASKAARAEMRIPDDDVSVEILPYGYKKKGDKLVPEKKARQFDNTPVSMHVRDGKLCIFDGVGLYEIPLDDVRGYRVCDEDYRIDFWLKEEEPTNGQYKGIPVKKCGIFEYKSHTYYSVEIRAEASGEVLEMLVPGYDFEELQRVIDLRPLM